MKAKANQKKGGAFFQSRREALLPDHQVACQRFQVVLEQHLEQGLLTDRQAEIVMQHVVRLAERDRNATNTGNLQDLFATTIEGTKDPIRAFAQLLPDSIKVVPMPDEALLMPPMKDLRPESDKRGALLTAVRELPLGAPQRMLAAHTNVAYTDAESVAAAREMIRTVYPDIGERELDTRFYQMAAQSQHMPSSSFVMAAASGFEFQTDELFTMAGYSSSEVEAARGFFQVAARFDKKWLALFMSPGPRDDPDYRAWLAEYHRYRQGLPADLKYQLTTDTLTNFHPGTMASGKWIDAAVQFSGTKRVEDVSIALAKVVNQYLAEFVDLHGEPAEVFIQSVSETMKDFGVSFDHRKGAFAGTRKAPPRFEEMRRQFEAAWHKKILAGVLKSSALFQRLGEGLSAKLIECFERVVFAESEVILKKGQEGNGLYVIVDGLVAVTFPASKDKGPPVELKTGDVFGEISLLSEGVTTAQVTAVKDTVTLVLRPDRFRDVVKRYSDMQQFLVDLADERLRNMNGEKRNWIITKRGTK